MNFYRAHQQFSKYVNGAIERLSVENATRAGAHACLLGATACAALGFAENGYPSESDRVEILACADHLLPKASTASTFNLSPACEQFTDDFAKPTQGSADYLLPPQETFLEDEMWTSRIEEERQNDFQNAFSLLSVALAGYAFIAFRRRLENPEPAIVADQAEEWLRSQPGQQ